MHVTGNSDVGRTVIRLHTCMAADPLTYDYLRALNLLQWRAHGSLLPRAIDYWKLWEPLRHLFAARGLDLFVSRSSGTDDFGFVANGGGGQRTWDGSYQAQRNDLRGGLQHTVSSTSRRATVTLISPTHTHLGLPPTETHALLCSLAKKWSICSDSPDREGWTRHRRTRNSASSLVSKFGLERGESLCTNAARDLV